MMSTTTQIYKYLRLITPNMKTSDRVAVLAILIGALLAEDQNSNILFADRLNQITGLITRTTEMTQSNFLDRRALSSGEA